MILRTFCQYRQILHGFSVGNPYCPPINQMEDAQCAFTTTVTAM